MYYICKHVFIPEDKMKIEISSVFKSWYDGNANKTGLLNAVDDMLLNMYIAVTEDDFSAKSSQEGYGNGNVRSIRGSAGTHGAFRMYCSMGHLAAKQPVLRLALVGTKQRDADQQKDINNASSIISSKTEEWTEWEPESPRLIKKLKELEAEKLAKEAAHQQANADKYAAKQAAQQAKAEKEAEKARKQAERKAAQERKKKEKEAEKARKQLDRKLAQEQKKKEKEAEKNRKQAENKEEKVLENTEKRNRVAKDKTRKIQYVNEYMLTASDRTKLRKLEKNIDAAEQTSQDIEQIIEQLTLSMDDFLRANPSKGNDANVLDAMQLINAVRAENKKLMNMVAIACKGRDLLAVSRIGISIASTMRTIKQKLGSARVAVTNAQITNTVSTEKDDIMLTENNSIHPTPTLNTPDSDAKAQLDNTKQQLTVLQNELSKNDSEQTNINENIDNLDSNVINDSSHDNVARPVTQNGETVSDLALSDGIVFSAVTDTQYQLAIIEQQLKIEDYNIEIARQNIAIKQAQIARTQLEIKKLQLLQFQKQSSLQK